MSALGRALVRANKYRTAQLDPGPDSAIAAGITWLGRAQDHSRSQDGGVARDYSLINGWNSSYAETTGYIVPTMLEWSRRMGSEEARTRAARMLDWLVSIQFPDGGFQGGVIGQEPRVPVTFNTGQILLGLASGVQVFGDRYRSAMQRAANWLCATQDRDGCWRKHPTPFAAPGEKVYETHVAWGLLEAARVEPNDDWSNAALRNVRWALTHQRANGWFDRCCLQNPSQPLTHTLGYALRGIIEAHRFTDDASLLTAARRTADGLLARIHPDGFLPGRFDAQWTGTVPWSCLTGSAQIACCWLLLHQQCGDVRYREAAQSANAFVRRTMQFERSIEIRGGVQGSFPVNGGYGAFEFLNWACKFCIDANMLEQDLLN
jgi:hypothetical protein